MKTIIEFQIRNYTIKLAIVDEFYKASPCFLSTHFYNNYMGSCCAREVFIGKILLGLYKEMNISHKKVAKTTKKVTKKWEKVEKCGTKSLKKIYSTEKNKKKGKNMGQ